MSQAPSIVRNVALVGTEAVIEAILRVESRGMEAVDMVGGRAADGSPLPSRVRFTDRDRQPPETWTVTGAKVARFGSDGHVELRVEALRLPQNELPCLDPVRVDHSVQAATKRVVEQLSAPDRVREQAQRHVPQRAGFERHTLER